jgi:flagellar biosynthetic protein FliQ
MLNVSIVIGLAISIFQAATQIHEQTLTFVPKIIAIAIILVIAGSWMLTSLTDFLAISLI